LIISDKQVQASINSMDSKLHALLIFCFFLISQLFRYGLAAISHIEHNTKFVRKVGRKLKKFGKHCPGFESFNFVSVCAAEVQLQN